MLLLSRGSTHGFFFFFFTAAAMLKGTMQKYNQLPTHGFIVRSWSDVTRLSLEFTLAGFSAEEQWSLFSSAVKIKRVPN